MPLNISAILGCAWFAASCTSSWEASVGVSESPIFVMMLIPKTLMPQWRATITSGTVLMPIASPPSMWYALYSAGVSYAGPWVPKYTPCTRRMPFSFATSSAILISLLSYASCMSGKRGPVGIFFPLSGFSGKKFMWSVITIKSPTRKSLFAPPAALLTRSVVIPNSYITRIGNVTSCMLYPS